MKKENKRPRDEQGKRHGYWEQYHYRGNLFYKGSYIHGIRYGLFTNFGKGKKYYKKFYIK